MESEVWQQSATAEGVPNASLFTLPSCLPYTLYLSPSIFPSLSTPVSPSPPCFPCSVVVFHQQRLHNFATHSECGAINTFVICEGRARSSPHTAYAGEQAKGREARGDEGGVWQ